MAHFAISIIRPTALIALGMIIGMVITLNQYPQPSQDKAQMPHTINEEKITKKDENSPIISRHIKPLKNNGSNDPLSSREVLPNIKTKQQDEIQETSVPMPNKPKTPKEQLFDKIKNKTQAIITINFIQNSGKLTAYLDINTASITQPRLNGLLGLTITGIAKQIATDSNFGQKHVKHIYVTIQEPQNNLNNDINDILTLSWNMKDLRKIKWDSAISSDILALGTTKSPSPMGLSLIANFCANGYTASRLCQTLKNL